MTRESMPYRIFVCGDAQGDQILVRAGKPHEGKLRLFDIAGGAFLAYAALLQVCDDGKNFSVDVDENLLNTSGAPKTLLELEIFKPPSHDTEMRKNPAAASRWKVREFFGWVDGTYISGSSGEFMGRLFLKPAAVSLRSVQVGAWVA